jgi:hypothetical protein
MSDALPPEIDRLLRVLIAKTSQGEVSWDPVEGSETEFMHTGKAGSILIASDDGDGRHPFTLSLLTPAGIRVEHWASINIDAETTLSQWKEIEKLYELARRSALGATTLVRDLLGELDPGGEDIPF